MVSADVPVETFNLDGLAVLDGAGEGDWLVVRQSCPYLLTATFFHVLSGCHLFCPHLLVIGLAAASVPQVVQQAEQVRSTYMEIWLIFSRLVEVDLADGSDSTGHLDDVITQL